MKFLLKKGDLNQLMNEASGKEKKTNDKPRKSSFTKD